MITLYQMDVLKALKQIPDESVDMQITSPPYWGLRDYGEGTETIWEKDMEFQDCEHEFVEFTDKKHSGSTKEEWVGDMSRGIRKTAGEWEVKSNFCKLCGAWKGQLGLEPDFNLYIKHLADVFDEVKRVLKKDGTCWINLGDTYNAGRSGGHAGGIGGLDRPENAPNQSGVNVEGMQAKCLCAIPERFMVEMINRGWILRNKIIWHKPNHMPTSVKDRFATSWEYLFFFSKSKKYYFDLDAVREPHKEISIQRTQQNDGNPIFQGNKQRGHPQGEDTLDPKQFCHPKGRNPDDVMTQEEYDDWYFNKREKKSWHPHKEDLTQGWGQGGRTEKTLPHPKGKNPDDVIQTKQDFIHNRKGYYDDPLHTKPNHPLGKNPSDFWDITTHGYPEAHFAVFPEALIERPIKTTKKNAVIMDIFTGSGTTLVVARRRGRDSIGIEIKKEYCDLIFKRLYKGNIPLDKNEFKLIK